MATDDHTYSVLSGSLGPNEETNPEMREFDHVITTFMREQNIPGASVAISKHGKIVYKQGYGISAAGRRVNSGCMFRIASISKSLTAICVLKLCEEEQLDLDALVFGKKGILWRFSPSSKGDNRVLRITVRHLLQHSAGWDRDIAGDPVFWNLEKITGCPGPVTNDQLIKYMMTKKLQFSPGKRHAYSNFGYLVLGNVIQAVTGTLYQNYVPLIFLQRGIEPMYIGSEKKVPDDLEPEEVEYFNNREPQVAPSIFADQGLVAPQYGSFPMATTGSYGGWVTSASVLVTIADSLSARADNPILSDTSIKTMFARPSYENSTQTCWYGLGWDVQDGGNTWGHTGAMEGTSCTLMRHESGLTWAVLFNAWAKDMDIDGMIKYGLSSVTGWPLYQSRLNRLSPTPFEIISADSEEVVRVQIPMSEVNEHDLRMRSRGYAPQHINAHFHSKQVFVNMTWRKCTHESYLLFHISPRDLPSKVAQAKRLGFSVSVLEAYDFHGETSLVINFEKSPEESHKAQRIYCDKPGTEHNTLQDRYKGENFLLVIQSIISRDGLPMVAAVYNKFTPNYDALNCEAEALLPLQKTYFRIKPCHFSYELGRFSVETCFYELTYLKFYDDSEDVSVSAIWTPKKGDIKRHLYYRRDDVSLYGFLYEIRDSASKNNRVRFLSSYCNEGVINFSTVWEAES